MDRYLKVEAASENTEMGSGDSSVKMHGLVLQDQRKMGPGPCLLRYDDDRTWKLRRLGQVPR